MLDSVDRVWARIKSYNVYLPRSSQLHCFTKQIQHSGGFACDSIVCVLVLVNPQNHCPELTVDGEVDPGAFLVGLAAKLNRHLAAEGDARSNQGFVDLLLPLLLSLLAALGVHGLLVIFQSNRLGGSESTLREMADTWLLACVESYMLF